MRDELLSFYTARDFRPVWNGNRDARMRAQSAVFLLRHADRQGLRIANYPVPDAQGGTPVKPGRDAAAYDLALTGSLLGYAHDVRVGRVRPDKVYKDVGLPPRAFDPGAALNAALEGNSFNAFVANLPPPHPGYRRLVAALVQYRSIVARGGWPKLSGGSRAKLVKRLAFEDPVLAAIAHPSAGDVKQAIARFQTRHGLDVDGGVGPATLRALNVPATRRVQEIAANLERWRWLPRHFEATYIVVDVPGQSVQFVRDGKSVLQSKAVVGRQDNKTPILRTTVDAVIANPPWDIPDDIAAKSLVPHLRRNPDYLETRNMVLVDAPPDVRVNWHKVRGNVLPYQIQQKPGPHNALGQLMLNMPNDFDVYLHGTPNKSLFKLDNRERSHGCVRVEKILDLGTLALAGSDGDSGKALSAAVEGGKTQRLPLARPLPVYMLYWTASAQPDGTVAFHPDRYGRDRPLIVRLAGRHG